MLTAQLFQSLPLKKVKIIETGTLLSAVSLQDVNALRPDHIQSVKFLFISVRWWVSNALTHTHACNVLAMFQNA